MYVQFNIENLDSDATPKGKTTQYYLRQHLTKQISHFQKLCTTNNRNHTKPNPV